MADVRRIKIDNKTYNIKDNVARTDISNVNAIIGDITQLTTVDKTSIVNAINSLENSQLYHSPKEYGAVGDGVADDTQAIDDCITNHNFIVFDDGIYKITSPINLKSDMRIIGNGTILNETEFQTAFNCININNIIIEGITFNNGARSGEAYTDLNANLLFDRCSDFIVDNVKDNNANKMACILLTKCERFIIENCTIVNSGYSGIMCYGECHYGKIINNYIKVDTYTAYLNTYGIILSCTPKHGVASKASECSYIIIDGNEVVTDLAFWEGIDSHAGDHLWINNNHVKGFHSGIVLTRYNQYTDSNGGSTFCVISNNIVEGALSLASGRDDLFGISIHGNENQSNDCAVIGNILQNMVATVSDVVVGTGIYISAHYIDVSKNTFLYNVDKCVVIDRAGGIIVNSNSAERSSRGFIYLGRLDNEVIITNNTAQNIRNFYTIMSNNTNINWVTRESNYISNSHWMGNTADVTDVSVFVPDKVNVAPTSSPYHKKGAIAWKSTPTAGQPMGWIANGSTWLAMPNLT